MASSKLTFAEYQAVSELTFDWADSYDTKDWDRLTKILTSALEIDYTVINNIKWAHMPRQEFIQMCSNLKFLGAKQLATQHLIGSSKYTKVSDIEIIGKHQVRAAHVLYSDISQKEVLAKGHGHGVTELIYRWEDGAWKLAGVKPIMYWAEHDIQEVIRISAEKYERGELE